MLSPHLHELKDEYSNFFYYWTEKIFKVKKDGNVKSFLKLVAE